MKRYTQRRISNEKQFRFFLNNVFGSEKSRFVFCQNDSICCLSPTTLNSSGIYLYIVEYKFRKSCEQIKLLTRRLDLLQIRYNKARRDDMKRYTQRLQLATVKGTRNMFYESAVRQAKEVAELARPLCSCGQPVDITN
jgi:hypothetical protein